MLSPRSAGRSSSALSHFFHYIIQGIALTTSPPQSPSSLPSIYRKPPPNRADDLLLLVARGAELSVDATNSLVLSTSVAGSACLKRVVWVSRTISAVGVSAPTLAVKVANTGILASHISIQHIFHPISFLKGGSPSKRSSASHLERGTGTTGQPGW